MSARSKVWGACRSLAVRSRPAAPRSRPFVQPIARPRWYSDESHNNSQTPRVPPETNAADYLKPEQSDALPSTPGDAAAPGTTAPGTNADSHIESLGDAELEKIFFSGKVTPKEGEPGLTDAQQEMLFSEGMIPPADEADALLEASAGGQGLVTGETALADSLGFKFPLPTKPYPSDFNHKKRYHPVLDQLTRLMMRDGKLSVAQRVGFLAAPSLSTARPGASRGHSPANTICH